jgi:hypothetical protein
VTASASKLTDLPNVGPATAADLRLLGIDTPEGLRGRDPVALYLALCARTGTRHDPCALDVLMAAVACVEHGDARPWWAFTAQRKAGWPAVEQALRAQGT